MVHFSFAILCNTNGRVIQYDQLVEYFSSFSGSSTLLEDGTQSPSKKYQTAFYPAGSDGDDEGVEVVDDIEKPLLNADRLRDLPPRDILARAFHGKFS